MFLYIIKRTLILFITLFGITVITFLLTRLTPGDPAALRTQSGGAGSSGGASYEDNVELTRRNLGLDRPTLINLRFEDRETAAENAISDYMREADFWKRDGEKKLSRLSTIAFPDGLSTLSQLAEGIPIKSYFPDGSPKDLVELSIQQERMMTIMPALAIHQPEQRLTTIKEAHEYWDNWIDKNRDRLEEDNVQSKVEQWMLTVESEGEQGWRDIRALGGLAIPSIVKYLFNGNDSQQAMANRLLSSLTGYSYSTSDEDFLERKDEILSSWRSWWRREKLSFIDAGVLRHTVNIFLNTQFGLWVTQAATLDFGTSYVQRRPVLTMIKEALPISLLLSGLSIFFSYLIAIPLGVFSAVRRYTVGDKFVTLILFVLYSLPSFWVAGILLLLTTGPPFLDWFPTRGLNSEGVVWESGAMPPISWVLDRGWHLILPVLCLTYGSLAFISRQMRSAMLETLNEDFIQTAQAKGLPGYMIIWKHAVRNSLIPILTISASLLPELIGGAVIIESIFTIPGMGSLTFEAIVQRDYPVINAVLFFSALLTLLGILLADISYAIADPRIDYSKE